MKADIDAMAEILPKANAAGMCLVLGDDYGAIFLPHGSYAEELAYYVEEIGIPALDVIRWATKHGAELMGRGHELGHRRPPASSPTCWWSTATLLADLAVLQDRRQPPGHHQGRPAGEGRPARRSAVGY